MGRPLSRKYFGRSNTDTSGNFSQNALTSDAELGGQPIAGITVGTPGTYTSASLATLTFPAPVLAVAGAITATGTPVYTAVSATVSGSQSGIYAVGQLLTVTTAGGTCTFRVASLSTNAVATVDLGTGASAGAFTSLAAGAQATTVNTGTGTGALLTITYGLSSVSLTNQGDGYLASTVGTVTVTATSASTATTITGGTIAGGILTITSASAGGVVPGMVLTGGAVTAGTYVLTRLTGTATGASTYQLGINNALGQPASATVVGAISGAPTTGTLNGLTLSSTVDMQPGMTFVTASGTNYGGLSGSTTYYIAALYGQNNIVISSTLASFTAVTSSATTAQVGTATFGQYSTVTVGGSGSGAATIVLATANTNAVGYKGSNAYPAIQAVAFLPNGISPRPLSDIVSQKGTRRYKVENIDGVDVCTLTDQTPPQAGFMAIQATDSAGGTYWITKLTKNGAVLTQNTGTQFATGSKAIWTTGTAVANSSVKIDAQ
jgi:hypothetical protein